MSDSIIPTIKPQNECDVITIFPMGVECIIQNPSNDKSFDGAATLSITGGTPPYTVYWEIGSYAPALGSLGVGEYEATVVDYYGDFTANTICSLTADTLTISGMCFTLSGVVEGQLIYISTPSIGLKNGKPHYFLQYTTQQLGYVFWNVSLNEWVFCQTLDCQITPYNLSDDTGFYPTGTTGSWVSTGDNIILITESYVGLCSLPIIEREFYDLCVSLEIRNTDPDLPSINVINIDLSSGTTINGQPSWTSDTGQYLLYWNNVSIPNQWTLTGYSQTTTFINNDPSYPPLSNWQILGNPSVSNITVTEGNCSLEYSVFVSATDNDALCGLNGSITVSASGGISPYTYSINGGQSYSPSPIFNNILPGTYSVMAKDSNNITGSFGNVIITNTPPVIYTLTLVTNYVNNTFSITAPTLPGGVNMSVDLVMLSLFTYYPIGITPTPSYNNVTTIQGITPMTLSNIVTNTITINNPCNSNIPFNLNAIQQQKTFINTLTFTSNQTITGSTTNIIVNNPSGNCINAVSYYNLSIVSPKINGCDCCELNLVNPVQPIPPTI